jgi:gas vesicle protein
MRATGDYRFPFLIVGVGLAVLVGFLWSPRAGKELRKELRRNRDEGVNFMNGELEKVRVGADDRWFAKISEYFGGVKSRLRGHLGERAD